MIENSSFEKNRPLESFHWQMTPGNCQQAAHTSGDSPAKQENLSHRFRNGCCVQATRSLHPESARRLPRLGMGKNMVKPHDQVTHLTVHHFSRKILWFFGPGTHLVDGIDQHPLRGNSPSDRPHELLRGRHQGWASATHEMMESSESSVFHYFSRW